MSSFLCHPPPRIRQKQYNQLGILEGVASLRKGLGTSFHRIHSCHLTHASSLCPILKSASYNFTGSYARSTSKHTMGFIFPLISRDTWCSAVFEMGNLWRFASPCSFKTSCYDTLNRIAIRHPIFSWRLPSLAACHYSECTTHSVPVCTPKKV